MIFFDEAGNSGANLLDYDQPVYVLLSHNFTKEEARQILTPLLSISKAEELHFKTIKKYQKSRNAAIECLNNSLIQKDRIFHYVADKEFMICIHMVDQLIEVAAHAKGIDLYKYGSNLSTANMMYLLGKNVWDTTLFQELCSWFVKWMRYKDMTACANFYGTLEKLYQITKDDFRDLLVLLMASFPYLSTIVSGLEKYTLDATLSCFNAHCHFWADIYKKPFDITFDDSKQIDYWRDMIDWLTNALPPTIVGYGSRKYKYPLMIDSLRTEKSHNSLEIQLADLFASSISYRTTQLLRNTEGEFANQIESSRLYSHTIGNKMWPTTLVTPEEMNMMDPEGINPLDFFVNASSVKKPGNQ